MKDNKKICVVGLGYVGLPLAVEFGKYYETLGYDIDESRIKELKDYEDRTMEVSSEEIQQSTSLKLTSKKETLSKYNVYIITVPTPINKNKEPDLSFIKDSTSTVGSFLSVGDIVIYESTVFPGLTEEICVPILEEVSGLKFNLDFFCGYSPERINPGDKNHKLSSIVKLTSGSNPQTAELVDNLYKKIIKAGTYKAESIKVAEAAKVIENTQRDLNIALINELSQIFNRLDIDTEAVLKAAETKWNFMPFRPGLVGGHCIGVDPYYLTFKAEELDFKPEVILAGRGINDSMSNYVSLKAIEMLKENEIDPSKSQILIMGLSFKENCPDIRNTKISDFVDQLQGKVSQIDIFDPCVDKNLAKKELDIELIEYPQEASYDLLILAVPHKEFIEMGVIKIRELLKPNGLIYDLKYLFDKAHTDSRL